LDRRIRFTDIVDVAAGALEAVPPAPISTLADALAADAAGRAAATESIARRISR
jgi:1-deoxy-D-xylulose 5-phosphate reductoisomerase